MKYEHVSYSLGCSKIVYVSHLHKVYKIMHKDKPLKKNHCTWVIFTRIFTDTMKLSFATSFMVLPLIILPNELQEFRRKNLWKNYIKISKRSLGKKNIRTFVPVIWLSIEFGTAIAALLVQLHNGDRNIFEVAFTFLYCFFLKS